ncbi:hypothetical protein [Paenibacillus zanthoxyli]|uniref:hypothetical protein n=1 Tax=Paenibacillus zanthoxyli TaxID=369399 RepID=UPI00056A7BD7|nr:hypothetical protein [Paenibacillus zanthoxyli]
MNMRSLRIRISIELLFIALILPSTYLLEKVSREKGLELGTIIRVQDKLSGSLVSLMGVDVLKSLMHQQYPGDPGAKGPTLLYAIGALGLSGYKQVEVKGLKKGQLLMADQQSLNQSYVLAFNEHGTVDLIDLKSKGSPIVQDVSEINKIE